MHAKTKRMKSVRRILLIILLLLAVVVLAGYLFPRKLVISRKQTIQVAPQYLYDQVCTLQNWEKWSPWHHKDTTLTFQYSEILQGPGAYFTWTSPAHNTFDNGKLILGLCEQNKYVELFVDFGVSTLVAGNFKFDTANAQTVMTCTLQCDFGANPFHRYLGYFLKKALTVDVDKACIALKTLAETEGKHLYEITEVEVPERKFLSLADTASPATVTQKLGTLYGEIMSFMQKRQIRYIGAPLAIYHTNNKTQFELEAAIPVNRSVKPVKNIKYTETPTTKALVLKYFGPYDKMKPAYSQIKQYIINKQLEVSGIHYEEYVTDPILEKDTAKWQTNIYYPLK